MSSVFSGWGKIFGRTGRAIYEDDCLGWAAQLAFFWFLALFPALLFVVALASSFPMEHLIDVVLGTLSHLVPDDTLALLRAELVQIAHGPPRGLLTLSLVGALWSSSSAMAAIIATLNQAYHVREGRSWWRVRLLAVVLTVVLVAVTLVAVTLMMAGPVLTTYLETRLGVSRAFASLWPFVEWPIVFGLMVTALGWIYYFAPDARRRWVWLTPGAAVATVLWILASLGFKWYASHFGDYQRTYGAIGGVIVALLWLYALGLAIIAGAELNGAVEQSAAERTAPRTAPLLAAGAPARRSLGSAPPRATWRPRTSRARTGGRPARRNDSRSGRLLQLTSAPSHSPACPGHLSPARAAPGHRRRPARRRPRDPETRTGASRETNP